MPKNSGNHHGKLMVNIYDVVELFRIINIVKKSWYYDYDPKLKEKSGLKKKSLRVHSIVHTSIRNEIFGCILQITLAHIIAQYTRTDAQGMMREG